jgi:hypothetical protein
MLTTLHLSPSQLVAISKAHGRSSAMLRSIASCCATWLTISVTDCLSRIRIQRIAGAPNNRASSGSSPPRPLLGRLNIVHPPERRS